MPARKPARIAPRDQMVEFQANDQNAAQRVLAEATRRLSAQDQQARSGLAVDLTVGDNRIVHQLGRAPSGCTITPTVADATFAWALSSKDDRMAVITVVGVAQPGAWVEFF